MKLFQRFRFQIIVRLLFITLTIYAFFYLVIKTQHYATIFTIGLLALYQLISFITFVEKTNRDLLRFLDAVRHADFSQSFSASGLGTSFDELNKAYTVVLKEFQQNRSEKEENHRYLQTIVQHVGIGLISYEADGRVDLINTTAKHLLDVPHLTNINALVDSQKAFWDTLQKLKPGEKSLVKIKSLGEQIQLAVYSTEFKLRDRNYTLVSLQDIHAELEEKELEAWQNLIRVLTHEIMNSMTPISSLSSTVLDLINSSSLSAQDSVGEDFQESMTDIKSSLRTIHKRSLGLMKFVQDFRTLTLISKPLFKLFSLAELFTRVKNQVAPLLAQEKINLDTLVEPETLELTADMGLIEQALLNLIINSVDAVAGIEKPNIKLEASLNEKGKVQVQVIDNGYGIIEEALPKIFIPFFTTKKEGSGIGLSFARQVMRLHQGTISVHSTVYKRTCFTLIFK